MWKKLISCRSAVATVVLFSVVWLPSWAQAATPTNTGNIRYKLKTMPPAPTPGADLENEEPARIAGLPPGYWRGTAPPYRYPRGYRPLGNPPGYYGRAYGSPPAFYGPRYRPFWTYRWNYYRGYGYLSDAGPWWP